MTVSIVKSNSGSRARRAKKNQALARKKFVDSYMNCDPGFGPLNLGGTSVPREVKLGLKSLKRGIDKVGERKEFGSPTVAKRTDSHQGFPSRSKKPSNILSREERRQSAQNDKIASNMQIGRASCRERV